MADARVLALDLGTSSVRALVLDGHGVALPGVLARRPTSLEIDDEGRAELGPDEVVAAIGECLDELAAKGELDQVAHVATSCAWHSVIAIDAAGRRQTGALTWADTGPRRWCPNCAPAATWTASRPSPEPAPTRCTGP